MAGMSGLNTIRTKSRSGYPRFPFESAGVGDGYTASGPVITYKLSPEELARYGPPTKRKDRNLSRGEVLFVVKGAKSMEHAARMARVTDERMKKEMVRHCIAVPDEWKEKIPMEDIQTYETPKGADQDKAEPEQTCVESPPENEPANRDGMEVYTPPQTRLGVLRSKITKEQYLTWKNGGLSDRAIM